MSVLSLWANIGLSRKWYLSRQTSISVFERRENGPLLLRVAAGKCQRLDPSRIWQFEAVPCCFFSAYSPERRGPLESAQILVGGSTRWCARVMVLVVSLVAGERETERIFVSN